MLFLLLIRKMLFLLLIFSLLIYQFLFFRRTSIQVKTNKSSFSKTEQKDGSSAFTRILSTLMTSHTAQPSHQLSAYKDNHSLISNKIYAIYGSQRGWANYVSEEYFHLFSHLKTTYQWREVSLPSAPESWATLAERCQTELGGIPSVLLFMESYDALNSISGNRLDLSKTSIWLFIDDIHSFTPEQRALKLSAIKKVDAVIGAYMYNLNYYFPEVLGLPRLWVPHAASGIFQLPMKDGRNVNRSVLLSGAVNEWYPYRRLVLDKILRGDERFSLHRHPGYGPRKDDASIGRSYASLLNSYLACITDGLVFNYTIAKIFELPAAGCLLLVNSEITSHLSPLGFLPGVHYIPYSRDSLETTVDAVLDEKNIEAVDSIRRQAQHLVWSRHTVTHRATTIHEFASNWPRHLSKQESKYIFIEQSCYRVCESLPAKTVDVIIFTKDRPLRLYALLESHFKHVINSGHVFVIFTASHDTHAAAYNVVKKHFPCVHFIDEGGFTPEMDKSSFQLAVESVLESISSPFVSPIVDEMVWLSGVDFQDIADFLSTSDPDGRGTFQLRLGLSYLNMDLLSPHLVQTDRSNKTILCYSWSSQEMKPIDAGYTTIVDAGVYSTSRLKSDWLSFRNYKHPGDLEAQWYQFMPSYGPGCSHFFYENSVIVNVESAEKVRSDFSSASDSEKILESSSQLLNNLHLDISTLFNYSPPYSHIYVKLALIPLHLCSY